MAETRTCEVKLTDEEFMEVIRDFPGVYDKNNEDFKDKTRKEECWEKISEILNVRIEDTKRRYETIRTRLSRHLKRIKEGYWSIDSKDVKLDFLHWLVPYIKTREVPFQYKHDVKRDQSLMYDVDDDIGHQHDIPGGTPTSGGAGEYYVTQPPHDDDVTRISMITIGGDEKTDNQNGHHSVNSSPIPMPVATSVTSTSTDFELAGNRKRKYEAMTTTKQMLPNTLRNHNNEDRNQRTSVYDEDEYYCLSLIGRLSKLDSKKKAYFRSTVEKLFLDFELGYVQFPKQSSYPSQ